MKIDELVTLGKSWNQPGTATSKNQALESKGYDAYERAYFFDNTGNNGWKDTEITFAASEENPFLNNAVIIKNISEEGLNVNSSNKKIKIRHDYKETLRGQDLVIWIEHMTEEPFSISISK